MKSKLRPVVVTTDRNKRGVFFGWTSAKGIPDKIALAKAQMAVYWSADVHGVLGLASKGPSASCRIGPPVNSIELCGVTAVMDASIEAVKAWEAQPWA